MFTRRFFGAENEARTRDLNLGKVALYQLSYFRDWDCKYTAKNLFCKFFTEYFIQNNPYTSIAVPNSSRKRISFSK